VNHFTKFFHELFHPHCEHCMDELRESRICNSCEVLQTEVGRLRLENERLLSRILKEPEVKVNSENEKEFKPIMPRVMSWNIKKQMLEREARASSIVAEQNKTPINKKGEARTTQELEEKLLEDELDNATAARENSSTT
jgi:hypothetical protein